MRFYPIVAAVTIFFLVAGCGTGQPAKKPAPQNGLKNGADTGGIKGTPPFRLPWDGDPDFIKDRQEHGTPLLIAEYHATLPDPILDERHNISRAADYLRGAVVRPGEVFSLNARIGWRSADRGFKPGPMYSGGRIVPTIGGGVCKIASVLYNVAILANQEIVERHPHSMTVPYVRPGQDATISYGTKDFKFRNITGAPILIWAKNTGGTLYIAFYGQKKPPHVRWVHKTLSKSPVPTERVNDPSMAEGTEKVIFTGSEGITVHSWIYIGNGQGGETEKDLGISAYRPSPRVVRVGTHPE